MQTNLLTQYPGFFPLQPWIWGCSESRFRHWWVFLRRRRMPIYAPVDVPRIAPSFHWALFPRWVGSTAIRRWSLSYQVLWCLLGYRASCECATKSSGHLRMSSTAWVLRFSFEGCGSPVLPCCMSLQLLGILLWLRGIPNIGPLLSARNSSSVILSSQAWAPSVSFSCFSSSVSFSRFSSWLGWLSFSLPEMYGNLLFRVVCNAFSCSASERQLVLPVLLCSICSHRKRQMSWYHLHTRCQFLSCDA